MKNKKQNYRVLGSGSTLIMFGLICFLLGIILGMMSSMLSLTHYADSVGYRDSGCAMSPDEACASMFRCDYGYGSMGDLRCYCDGSWEIFTWEHIYRGYTKRLD